MSCRMVPSFWASIVSGSTTASTSIAGLSDSSAGSVTTLCSSPLIETQVRFWEDACFPISPAMANTTLEPAPFAELYSHFPKWDEMTSAPLVKSMFSKSLKSAASKCSFLSSGPICRVFPTTTRSPGAIFRRLLTMLASVRVRSQSSFFLSARNLAVSIPPTLKSSNVIFPEMKSAAYSSLLNFRISRLAWSIGRYSRAARMYEEMLLASQVFSRFSGLKIIPTRDLADDLRIWREL